MTDQTIPADKVRELADRYDQDSSGNPERLLVQAIADLRALLPTPPQPTSGLLGRWAKHPDYGDVMCVANEPVNDKVLVFHLHLGSGESLGALVPLSSLTFPHQATKPADVPAGEAWLVDVEDLEESHKSIVALKDSAGSWRTSAGVTNCIFWRDEEVTLICPLTPERPGKDDLQAKYDVMDAKYREAQEKIKVLEQANTPRTASTEAEYAALPTGSIVGQPDQLDVYIKDYSRGWDRPNTTAGFTSRDLAGTTRTVLRYGWGDEQPVWRIEYSPNNLRVGEYIIDCEDDDGTVTHKWRGRWDTDGAAYGAPQFAPWIAFTSKDAATPEAIAEAKKARDEEMYK